MVSAAIDSRLMALQALEDDERPKSEIERAAIRRQMEDLRTGHQRGLVWDEDEAQRNVKFFGLLRHWKGEWARKPMDLANWQEHLVIAPMFGWMREMKRAQGGVRRFQTAYIEIPRKNGKTTIASGIGNQGLIADGEAGAEVYAAATKRDQAMILFTDAKQTIGPKLTHLVKPLRGSIVCNRLNSTFQPLSSDYDSLDGLNIHRAIVDELHAHKNRHLWDVLLTGMGARRQPMIAAITTAGFDKSSICWEQHTYTERILQYGFQDDSHFGFVACAEQKDDWTDPQTWWKANPNLGISLKKSYLEDLCRKAMEFPDAQNNFRRKHLDQWTEQEVRWLPMEMWRRCAGAVNEEELYGRRCWVGLDLASTRDVNALVLVFPTGEGSYKVLPYFFIPKEPHDKRGEQDRRQVKNWASKGVIEETEGNTTDYQYVVNRIMDLSMKFDIQEIAYDPHGPANVVVQMLQAAGFDYEKLIEFRQTLMNFTGPCKHLEKLLASRKIEHGGNPVLEWMAGNVTVRPDSNDNIRPDKGKSSDKIDGIVALLMALGRIIEGEHEYTPTAKEMLGFI